jgi:hypothetical protein
MGGMSIVVESSAKWLEAIRAALPASMMYYADCYMLADRSTDILRGVHRMFLQLKDPENYDNSANCARVAELLLIVGYSRYGMM